MSIRIVKVSEIVALPLDMNSLFFGVVSVVDLLVAIFPAMFPRFSFDQTYLFYFQKM